MRFDSYHPAINFLYFISVITATIMFRHPVFLMISLVCAFAYTIKLNGWKGFAFGLFTLVLAAFLTYWYNVYNHFGVTVLRTNFIGNRVTLEALLYGASLSLTVSAVLIWFSCVHTIISTDKVVYLFGRFSPKLSLFLSILLRMVPRIKKQAQRIQFAQQAIGRGVSQGNIFQRIKNGIRVFSILLSWVMESFITSSNSMRSRGNTLKGRTAFSLYRFDNRDRGVVVTLFFCLTLMIMAMMLHQTEIHYDPRIVMNPITPMSYIFYAGYAFFCLLPLGLQLFGEIRFKALQRTIAN